jgi:hypothetical protein
MKKSKTKATIKHLIIPQYATCNGKGYKVKIVVTENVSDFIEERFPSVADATGEGAAHIYEIGFESWIILPEDASISTIVHECWHCVHRIMKKIGAELENEVVAYTLGWLTEVATDFLYSTPGYQKKAKEFLKKKIDKTKRKTNAIY